MKMIHQMHLNSGSQTIEGYYVDGISLTHGPPGSRQHIWTFAGGLVENNPSSYPYTGLVHVLTVLQHDPLFPPLWEMTTFVRVGILPHLMPSHSFQTTHSGMVRVVALPPAAS